MKIRQFSFPSLNNKRNDRFGSFSSAHHQPDDDEESLSSTFTVEEEIKQPLHVTACSSSTPRRTVHFDTKQNVSYDNEKDCFEDCAERWYQPTDYTKFKYVYTMEAKKIIRDEREMGGSSFQGMLEGVFEVMFLNEKMDLNEPAAFRLTRATPHLLDRTGLERATCKNLRNDKKQRRNVIRSVVLEAQEMYYYDDDDRREALIAQASERVSAPSRGFAQLVARLQEECYLE